MSVTVSVSVSVSVCVFCCVRGFFVVCMHVCVCVFVLCCVVLCCIVLCCVASFRVVSCCVVLCVWVCVCGWVCVGGLPPPTITKSYGHPIENHITCKTTLVIL